MSNVSVRVAHDDELETVGALRVQSYGFSPRHGDDAAAYIRRSGLTDRVLVAVDGSAVVGSLVVLPFGQFWRGRPVPTGGIGGVVVRPESRGRRIGVALLEAACAAMRERSEVLSVLGPATMPIYRACGWEMGGRHRVERVPTADLARLPATSTRERAATSADHDAIKRVYLRGASARNGMLARPAFVWDQRLAPRPGRYIYVVERDADVVGYVIYLQHKRGDQPGYLLTIEDLGAGDWDAECTLWRHIGAHRAQVSHALVHAPTDALALQLHEQQLESVWSQNWMLRVVDAPGAMRARGFPAGLSLRVPLTIVDNLISANTGDWVLEVDDGRGMLTRATSGAATGPALTSSGLAALYSGFASTAVLASGALLAGGSSEDRAALDAAFAGQPALYNDDF
jgi:predicted acetyltransferase